jgi:hypothetical protein
LRNRARGAALRNRARGTASCNRARGAALRNPACGTATGMRRARDRVAAVVSAADAEAEAKSEEVRVKGQRGSAKGVCWHVLEGDPSHDLAADVRSYGTAQTENWPGSGMAITGPRSNSLDADEKVLCARH